MREIKLLIMELSPSEQLKLLEWIETLPLSLTRQAAIFKKLLEKTE